MDTRPRPYGHQTHRQLTDLARRALIAATREEPGSLERAMRIAAYDSVVDELKYRVVERLGAEMGPIFDAASA